MGEIVDSRSTRESGKSMPRYSSIQSCRASFVSKGTNKSWRLIASMFGGMTTSYIANLQGLEPHHDHLPGRHEGLGAAAPHCLHLEDAGAPEVLGDESPH